MERRLFSRWNVCWDCSQLPRKKDFVLLTFGVFFAIPSGGEKGNGTWGRRRGVLFMSSLQEPQTSTVD